MKTRILTCSLLLLLLAVTAASARAQVKVEAGETVEDDFAEFETLVKPRGQLARLGGGRLNRSRR